MERNIKKLMRSLRVELFVVWGIIVLTWILGEVGVIPNGELVAQGQQLCGCGDDLADDCMRAACVEVVFAEYATWFATDG